MPVIRPSKRDRSLRDQLIELLFKELMEETSRNGPTVFEIPVDPDSMDVIVVWGYWGGIKPDDRTLIIREAYSRYSRSLQESVHFIDPSKKLDLPMVPKVMMASGVTPQEALEQHLLPWSVTPDSHRDGSDRDEIESYMIQSGAIRTSTGVQLRFPKFEMAKEVAAQLGNDLPDVRWEVVEEARPFHD